MNRSAAIVIGYLMWKTHSSYDDVFDYVKKRRECIELNNLFIMQLHKFQNLLKNNNYNIQKIEVNPKIK
jgi:protein-tyrosine phosphatase